MFSIGSNSNLERPVPIYCNPTRTWCGDLPPRTYKDAMYSRKVFLGGTPRDITEVDLIYAFKQFGSIKVEWPGNPNDANSSKGFAYIIFEEEEEVESLIEACAGNDEGYYYTISSRSSKIFKINSIA